MGNLMFLARKMIPQSWYKYIVRVDYDVVYCDHLSVCLLAEIINKQQNPVITSYLALSQMVNHLVGDVKHSLQLLENLDLIKVTYPTEPEKLLSGAIAISLNQNRINQITTGEFTTTKPRKNARDGLVYVIRAGETNLYKIGRTTNIDRRLRQLQNMNSQTLSVVKLIHCHDACATESFLHSKFKSYRCQGEWFKLSPSAIDFINNFTWKIDF